MHVVFIHAKEYQLHSYIHIHVYIYRKKPTEDEVAGVEERKEDVEYTCGGQIFQEPCLVYVEVKVQ